MKKLILGMVVMVAIIGMAMSGCVDKFDVSYPVTVTLDEYPGTAYVLQEDGTVDITVMGFPAQGTYVVTEETGDSITYELTVMEKSVTLTLYEDGTVFMQGEDEGAHGKYK